ncbi:MAG TPA: hypothetical protein VFK02_19555 [Kofleriaceae bacterium]|nr:hypothetical protein [Kofleriaceae bacterium]
MIAHLGCGDNHSDRAAASDPTDPAQFGATTGETLAFGVQEGNLRNYFHRQGPSAVHLLARSGTDPRIIAAFPANNQGIGLWFTKGDASTKVWAGADGDADLTAGGGLVSVVRHDPARDSFGVRATIHSDATTLTAFLPLLANIRTLRDYGYGLCLENAGQFPELRNETIEAVAGINVVRIRREQIGGSGHAMEILLKGVGDTKLAVNDVVVPPRANCAANADGKPTRVVEISGSSGVSFDIIALSDDEPLTPIEKPDLLAQQPPDSFEFNALAFLSYSEKLEAGTWRFLTYFGRDTLLSIRMLMPGLRREVAEAALTAVLERINLTAGVPDPNFDYTIEVGDVAHEEELGDYAAWHNSQLAQKPADLRQPRYDYKMIDDDFLLAPVLVEYMKKVTAEAATPDDAKATIDAFLARTRPDGMTFKAAIEANLKLVLDRARPFADDTSQPDQKKTKLIHLKNTVPVGQWRDSDLGIAFGRFPFDINVGLAPGALAAAVELYNRFADAGDAAEAQRIHDAWLDTDELFRVPEDLAAAKANVTSYAQAVGVTDTSSQLEATEGNTYSVYAISLDGTGRPLPVMHTDHGFVMEFAEPSDAYLVRVANTIRKDFPAGLMSKVGVMVANPALAPADFTVTDPKNLKDPNDDVPNVKLRDIYTNSQYHGTVVWSWQQALLASGIRRQLERTGLRAQTVTALQQAECTLWDTIDAAQLVRAGELWSWAPNASGQLEYRAFGYNLTDVDESNAAQLWSTVYLVVKRPTAAQNPSCVPPARARS